MTEFSSFSLAKNKKGAHSSRSRLFLLLFVAVATVVTSPASRDDLREVQAAPLALTFESTTPSVVTLGSLASRTQCRAMSKQGVGPYTMTGTDFLSNTGYSYVTDKSYSGAQINEGGVASGSLTYTRTPNSTYGGKSGVLQLSSSGSISWSNSCGGLPVYGSAFGPEVFTAAFPASAGQALSFNWAAANGGDDYEVYAFLVKVAPSGATYDYGGSGATLISNSTLLAHGRGGLQPWRTSTGSIPSDGYYRFRFVNGSYDASGGLGIGATMYIDPNVLVGEANNISFAALNDRVTSSSAQTFTVSASATSAGPVTFTSSTTARCTVGSSTTSDGVSSATVTLLANATGLCSLTADSASVGDYATAASVARSFTILAAPTAPSYSGGTAVTGTASVGGILTAGEGSWGDGGSPITNTSFQWQVCPNPASCVWFNVANATTSTYLIGSSDVGKQFRVVLTKTNSVGSSSSTSAATATVAKGNQSTVVVSSTTATFGSTLQLTISGGSGSGAVSFAVISGTCTVNSGVLTPGNAGSACVVRATKAADSSYNAATSADATITISKATQAPLQISSTSGTFGVGLSLATTGGSGTGAISYAVISGMCQLTGSILDAISVVSACVVQATKAGDANYLSAASSDTTITFAKGTQYPLTITSVTAVYGSELQLTTSGGSGTGSYSFTVTSGNCSLQGSVLTTESAGSSCVVQATKAGDDNYLSTTSAETPITTSKAVQSALTLTTTSTSYREDLVLGVSGGSGSGSVSYVVVSGTCTVVGGLLTPGNAGSSCVVRATKATDVNYNERSSANTVITVNKASQSGLNITSPLSFITGSNLSLYATGGQSSGSLSWSLNSGTCVLANTTLTASRGGISCSVEVTRAGDNNYYSSSVSETITVEKITQVLTFRSTPPASAVVGGTYTLQVESDASLAPTLVIANSSASVCSISAGVVTFNAVGTCVISASQSGNDVYAPAAASQSLPVGAVPTTTPTTPGTGGSSTSNSGPSTTTPQNAIPAPASTTTTTSTTVPADPGAPFLTNGETPELEAGQTTAIVRGQQVEVVTTVENGQITMTLPGNVVLRVGSGGTTSGAGLVGADGVLRTFGNTEVEVGVSGFVPKSTFSVFMFSEPIELSRGEASSNGTINETVLIPKDVEGGEHTLQINGVGSGDEVISVSMGFEVMKRESNTAITVTVILLAIALALLGGRPILKRRRQRV